jgi:hypothetical protein
MAMAVTEKIINEMGIGASGSEMHKRYGDSWNKAIDAGRAWADEYIIEKLRQEPGSKIAWEEVEKNLVSQIPAFIDGYLSALVGKLVVSQTSAIPGSAAIRPPDTQS